MPSPFKIVSVLLPKDHKKSVLDALNGYHSVSLSTTACDATTFITEWGHYRYIHALQGFHTLVMATQSNSILLLAFPVLSDALMILYYEMKI